ncbi:MAG: peptidoglycan DD-metalloendopeptidase family protein [Candidatus Woesebacteria bacterium]|nr:peptidoglycan DD-metalloendopeptidase family protein [Candidatus Woesebacteria bacterium]
MARAQFNRVLTKIDIEEIRNALAFYYPQVIGEKGRADPGKYPTKNFLWSGRVDFNSDIKFLTDVDLTHVNESQLYQSLKIVDQSLGKLTNTNPVESNRPTTEELASMEEERAKREASQKKAVEDAEKSVEEAIKKQQEIQKTLRDKKIYAKVEVAKGAPVPDENTAGFIEEAKNHPVSFQKDLEASIKARLASSLSGTLTDEEIGVLAKKAAYDTVTAINNFPAQSSANTQAAILSSLSQDTQTLSKIIADKNTAEFLKRASSELSFYKNQTQLSKTILSSVNENLANSVFGTGPENLNVSFTTKPTPGYDHEVDLEKLNQGHTDLLGAQSNALDMVRSFAGEDAKRLLTGQVRNFIDSQITKLPADSAISEIYNSKVAQQVLSSTGFDKAAPLGESLFGTVIQQIPGGTAFLEGIGNFLGVDMVGVVTVEATGTVVVESGALVGGGLVGGIDAGINVTGGAALGIETQVAPKVVAAAAGQTGKLSLNVALGNAVAKGASAIAAKLGFTAASAKIGATIGTGIIPVIGTIAGLVLGALFGKVIEKVASWAKKHQEDLKIVGGAMLVGGIVVNSIPVIIVGGLIFVPAALRTGFSMAMFARRTFWFFGRIARSIIITISTPVIVTIVIIPILVAIILFIINSGAYIVPPTGSFIGLQNPYIGIDKKASPAGPFNNSDIPSKTKIEYTVTVSAKKGLLTNITFKDECKVIKNGAAPPCPSPSQATPVPPDSISPSSPFTFKYTLNFDSHNYDDSAIVNTFTVTADAVEEKGVTTAGSASIIVGKPPMECPNRAWPLANDEGINNVTQGPMTPLGWTHSNTPNAIDIGVSGATIVAMHSGIASIGEGACGGKWVKIASLCGSSFSSYYGHLGAITVTDGQKVTIGQTLGISDNTGSFTSGAHLHFQFFDTGSVPTTQKPYLKRNIPIGCTNQLGNLCN